jgi:hypothetical protein
MSHIGLLLSIASFSLPAQAQAPQEVTVFTSGKDGYHTFRIPAVVVTKKGTVLAFCEGRKNSRSVTVISVYPILAGKMFFPRFLGFFCTVTTNAEDTCHRSRR